MQPPTDFLLITALEEERDALLGLLPGNKKLEEEEAIHTYYEAVVETRDRQHYNIIVTCLDAMGPVHAAARTACAVIRWKPRAVIMLGIAGGLRAKVKLGDILVADLVADYSLGRIETGADGKLRRKVRWCAHPADPLLLNKARNLNATWSNSIACKRPEAGEPKRHPGTVASGGDVVADDRFAQEYSGVWSKLIGIEMEGAGVATGLYSSVDRPRFLMVRGVSDYADPDKNETGEWRTYACATAAAFTIALLQDRPLRVLTQAATANQSTTSGTVRSRDVRTLQELLNTLDSDTIDLFYKKAESDLIPDQIFYFLEGFRAVYTSSGFYLHDTALSKAVTAFGVPFIRSLSLGSFFVPINAGAQYRFAAESRQYNYKDFDKARNQFEKDTKAGAVAFRSLLSLIRTSWPEIDLNSHFEYARGDFRRFHETDRTIESSESENDLALDAAVESLKARARAAVVGFVADSNEASITLNIESELELAAANRLVDSGLATIVGESVTLTMPRDECEIGVVPGPESGSVR